MSVRPTSGLRPDADFVLRTPALPNTLAAWAAAGDARAYLAAVVARPDVREALYVASPGLATAIASWESAPHSAAGRRVERSLIKYVARMMCRATPFGLFSAVSVGRLGKTTELALAPRAENRRRTRLDNDYLFVLADNLARSADARDRLAYRPNTSLYRLADRVRYAEARVADGVRHYELVSVDATPYLDATLARAGAERGATRAELATALVSDAVTAAEATAYIDQLIDAQVLAPELGVHVTGPEPLDGLLAQLAATGLEAPRAVLAAVRARLGALDAGGVGQSPERYTQLAAELEPLGTKIDPARLFQVDMVKPARATLATRIAADVARAIEQLARINARIDKTFEEFRRAFAARYEQREVPLAEALDEESGIGFEAVRAPGSEGAPLLADLPFGAAAKDTRTRWTPFEHHMLRRVATALAAGAHEIALEDADLTAMAVTDPAPLPDALCAMIRIAAPTGATPAVFLDSAAGPSGARMLGRFSHASREIEELVRAHHAAEEALRPGAVFAEIVHLNEGRIGNVLCRPVLRGHEIVFLGISGAARDAQLPLSDLYVSVREDRVVLTSRRLGVEVVPRLTTAHNYRQRTLGVYRFLCALSSQGTPGAGWSWGALEAMPYLPRVRIGGVLVARSRWYLETADLAPLTKAVRAASKDPRERPAVLAAVAALRAERRLPRMLAIEVADNELPIDLDNPLLAEVFADEIAGGAGVVLVELFPAVDELPVRGDDGGYADEIVLTYTRDRQPTAAPVAAAPPVPALRRSFAPASEWLYAKIYCGEATADRVLIEAVAPAVRETVAAGDIDRWFFIRYNDPDPHLRVRVHGEPHALVARVLPALAAALTPLAKIGAVHRWQLDTYDRELERYGGEACIARVEELFWRDSEAVLGIVELLEGADGEAARWKLALRGMDSLLEALGLSDIEREKLAGEMRDQLGREVNAGTPLWTKIGDRFVRERADLDVVFARDPARDAEHDLQPGFDLLAARDAAIAPIAAELRARDAAGVRRMAASLAHMHGNRLLRGSERAQEMVLYDFLKRLHASRRARASGAARDEARR